MSEVIRLSRRLEYLEDQLKQIQPVKSAAELENVASIELSIIEELKKEVELLKLNSTSFFNSSIIDNSIEELKKEVELLKLNSSSSCDLEALKQEMNSLKESNRFLLEKVQELEQSTTGMLDRVLTLKEKIEPTMALNLLEARVMSLEERCAVREVVGIGIS